MNWPLLLTCLLIALGRVTDMTLDTLRIAAMVQGRRALASSLGFVGSIIYLAAVAKVLQHLDHFVYVIAYAAGFASGNFLGITIEQRMALGQQIVSIFTPQGDRLAMALRGMGYRVTEFQGRGRDGAVAALYIEVPRKLAKRVVADARQIDPDCFYLVNDVRHSRTTATSGQSPVKCAA